MATVKMLEGRHITASDKRNIVEGIEYLATMFAAEIVENPEIVPNYANLHVSRAGSPKSYQITPLSAQRGTYAIVLRTRERNDYGKATIRTQTIKVEVSGVPALYLPHYAGELV